MLKKLFKRTRDVYRQNLKPQEQISFEEWEDITDRYAEAKKFKSGKLYQLLKDELKHGEEIVIENRVHEVQERRVISDVFEKIFVIPKKEQMDELIGQLKFIRGFLNEVDSWIARKEDLEKMEANGKITIDRGKK